MTDKKQSEVYILSPLPFQGQKRTFVRQFRGALSEFVSRKPIHTVVDLFGGSGLLSHAAKRMFPNLNVIYNDFDDFHIRIENIPRTNQLLDKLRIIAEGVAKNERITDVLRDRILSAVYEFDQTGFVDYVTLSGSLLFSGKYVTGYSGFKKETFYNRIRKGSFCADGYLDGLVVVKSDYFKLYSLYRQDPGVLFVVDPPYLSTDTKSYSLEKYWKIRDYLNVLLTLDSNYIFFTSEKSQLVDLCNWLADYPEFRNPFQNAKLCTVDNVVNYSSGYRDMMLYNID